ncbi:MAG: hypothetical protein DDT40_01518 [candidate division WS2 bacterium]|nr:hypothetical protein [Candidatus Psychracetigena formicireducens]
MAGFRRESLGSLGSKLKLYIYQFIFIFGYTMTNISRKYDDSRLSSLLYWIISGEYFGKEMNIC